MADMSPPAGPSDCAGQTASDHATAGEQSSEAAQFSRFLELDALVTSPEHDQVSLAIMDEYQRLLPRFGVYTVDSVFVGPPDPTRMPNSDPILNTDCIPIPGTKPLVCPRSSPKLPVELLPQVEARFRSLRLVDANQTVLWVGRQGCMNTLCMYRNGCTCFAEMAPPPPTATERGEEATPPPPDSPKCWADMGDAKRAILTVLRKAKERLEGQGIATKAGYKYGTLRHHFGELKDWNYIDRTKDGYAIMPAGSALVPV